MPDGTSSSLSQVKISELPVAPGINDTDQLEANQAGTTRSITAGQLKAAAVAAVPIPPALTDTSPRSFGAVGDGVTDDTAALQAAINTVNAAGGGNINCTGGRWLIDSAILQLKSGVFLVGPWSNVGQPPAGNEDYTTIQSAFIVNPAYSIRLGAVACGIQGMAIVRKGLTIPATLRQAVDLVATFSGTAIQVSFSDSWLSNLLILGFATGISSTAGGRSHIEWITADNLSGIYISSSFDMQHLSHVHSYPFTTFAFTPAAYAVSGAVSNGGLVRLTIAANVLVTGDRVTVKGVGGATGAVGPFTVTVINPTTIDLQGSTFGGAYTSGGTVYLSAWYRSGVGINFGDIAAADWGQADSCFSYNYAIGFRVNSSNEVTLVNCGTDSYAPAGDTSTIGILITGTTEACSLIGCKTSAQGVNLKIDVTPPSGNQNTVHVSNHRSWGPVTYAAEVSNGYGMFVNCVFQQGGVIRIDDAAVGVNFTSCVLTSVTYSYQSATSPRPAFVGSRGQGLFFNPVVHQAGGSAPFLTRYENHSTTPTNNDGTTHSYVTTDSAGTQIEVARMTTRAPTISAGATTGQVFWALQNGSGTLTNYVTISVASLAPTNNDVAALGAPANQWSDLFLATGGVINWNSNQYTLTHSGTTLTTNGALTLGGLLTGLSATLTGNMQFGTLGAGNTCVIRGTDNGNTLIVMGTAGTKFFYVKPETALDTAQIAYYNGSINANIDFLGTVHFPTTTPVSLYTTAVAAGSATQAFIKASSTANLGIYYGTGVPSFSAAKGSLYTNTTATTTTTRLYVNTDGAGTWATLTTSA